MFHLNSRNIGPLRKGEEEQGQYQQRMGGGGRKVCLTPTSVLTDPHPPQPDSCELVQSPQYRSTLLRVRGYQHKQGEVTPSKPHGRWLHVCR